jgi:hypothetical protein
MNFLQFERFGKLDEQTYRNHFEKKFDFMEFNKILINYQKPFWLMLIFQNKTLQFLL